ncbi:hypothetical protein AB0K05_15445 [Nonomuraea sp. NPDC049486]|uniref:hypothetical protein n=1 Tax=Nonomuraea sp. NPDC049486 TaxID=3155773 RepID=UPI00343136BB
MSTVEHSLGAWAASATTEQLDSGPSLDDLGGAEAVTAEARALAVGPHLPTLLRALVHPASGSANEIRTALVPAIAKGLQQPFRAWVLAEAIEVLCSHPMLLEAYGSAAAKALLGHAEAALAGEQDPAFAQHAVAGLLQLSLGGFTNHRRLLLLLTEISGGEPAAALERLPLLIGIAHDHYEDAGLLEVLRTLEGSDTLSSATRNDARYELALATLRAGLGASDRQEVMRLLRAAALRLQIVETAEEARLDARAYRLALDAVFAFIDLEGQPTAAVRSRLVASAQNLDQTVTRRYAWSARMHKPQWLEARGQSEAAWSQLVATLRQASARLLEPSWLDACKVLTDVLQVYQASRSVYTVAGTTNGGLEQLVSPPVEAAFVRELGLLNHLEQALENDPELIEHPDVWQLHAKVAARRQALETGSPAEPPGKSAAEQSPWATLLNNSDPVLQRKVLGVLREHERGYALTGNILLDRQLEQLHGEVIRSPAWMEPERSYFATLLMHFLRFLHIRFDAQADLLGDVTAYLGPPKPGEKYWLEEHVQNDCLQYLGGMLEPPGSVQREVIDIASGRTDITYTPESGMRLVVEVKRHTSKWTRAGIEEKYIPQTANYTATGPPFCILLVGDHSNHAKGYTSLEDSVWNTWRARSITETPRFVVVGVLPIGRPTPSDMTKLSRRSRSRQVAQPNTDDYA